MRSRMAAVRCLLVISMAGASTLVSPPARADLAECIAASEHALSLRRAGKLEETRKELVLCAAAACPDEVRADCGRRIETVNAAMPSLVIAAKDGAGNDVLAAEVTIDGVRVAVALDGRPIEVDPGEHVVQVTAAGQPPAERKLVVAEGQKTRHEAFVLGPVAAPPPQPSVPVIAPPAEHRLGTQRALAIVSTAVGVAGVGAGAAFGLLASSKWSSAKTAVTAQDSCASTAACPAHSTAVSDHDSAETSATVSTIAFGVGAALIVTGVVTWLTAPAAHPATDARRRPTLVPTGTPGGGGLTLVGEF